MGITCCQGIKKYVLKEEEEIPPNEDRNVPISFYRAVGQDISYAYRCISVLKLASSTFRLALFAFRGVSGSLLCINV